MVMWGAATFPLWYLFLSFPPPLARFFCSLTDQLFCPSLGQTNEPSWSPPKKGQMQIPRERHLMPVCTHPATHIHTSSKAIGTPACKDLRSARSVCYNLSRIIQSWWSCDICEHCVPVNAITHYPLSLPAQADWLYSSLPPSLPLCHFLHNCTVVFSAMWFLCTEITWIFL